jgi:predicted unusual protein kinase regulating ubiquinone biosynthesis (AarF/ABC1/UbiB family)
MEAGRASRSSIDRLRYRRVRRFFLSVMLRALWWDLILNRPLLRRLRPPALPRWQMIARRFRELALEMGGVLIKLGQFLSSRVDLLPEEITDELAGLQDKVPAAPTEAIIEQVEEALGKPLDQLFEWFDPQPLGAASLAQVHAARIAGGDEVVVKVLRPGIEVLVETDLAAVGLALGWLKRFKRVRAWANLDWIEDELSTVTRRELDLVTEGKSAERFARDFADDDQVIVPEVFWDYTATQVLTLENVAFIKVNDIAALDQAGISRRQVAKVLYGVYMRQLFVSHFVHADPHPGNIFVKAMPLVEGQTEEPESRPFALAFVDFGMMTEIPERLRRGLREFAIGLGTRDARRIVSSYVTAGTVLPGADLERLIAAHEAMFEHFWGVRLADLRDVALTEAQSLLGEFRYILFQAPIQLQADMLFASRAVGLLAGLATSLDQQFDPWQETVPYAEQFAREERIRRWREWIEELGNLAERLLQVPAQLDRLLDMTGVERPGTGPGTGEEGLQRAARSVDLLAWMTAAGALLISGSVLTATGTNSWYGEWLLGGAGVTALVAWLRQLRG